MAWYPLTNEHYLDWCAHENSIVVNIVSVRMPIYHCKIRTLPAFASVPKKYCFTPVMQLVIRKKVIVETAYELIQCEIWNGNWGINGGCCRTLKLLEYFKRGLQGSLEMKYSRGFGTKPPKTIQCIAHKHIHIHSGYRHVWSLFHIRKNEKTKKRKSRFRKVDFRSEYANKSIHNTRSCICKTHAAFTDKP